MKDKILKAVFLVFISGFLTGCATTSPTGNYPWVTRAVPTEADWIRKGESLEFEGEKWFPMDDVENLLDSEVYQVGEYRGLPVFAELIDVRPYDRLYTKFSRNKYRLFEKKAE